ncbi:hypothetical protein BASA60_001063, partial [Batrachochytrium salamandrivorans]
GLEARSYQPVLNSYKDSATLVSLERRDNSGSDLPPLLIRQDTQKIVNNVFKESDFSSANIAATIDRVGDGVHHLFDNGEQAGRSIGGTAGPPLARYLSRTVYVIVALGGWVGREQNTIFDTIKSVLGDEEYSKISRDFINTSITLTADAARKENEVSRILLNIIEYTGNHLLNAKMIGRLFEEAFAARRKFFDMLRSPLKDAASSKTLYDNISAMIASLDRFLAEQQRIHGGLLGEFKLPSLK